jgi:uncharacterized protein YjdB
MKTLKRHVCWVVAFVVAVGLISFSSPITAAAAGYGSISIHQGSGELASDTGTIVEYNISTYYPETGPLVVQIDSMFTSIAADNAIVRITNSKSEVVYSDTGNKYFLKGTYALFGLKDLPKGKYKIELIWGALDLGDDGFKDFTIIDKGRHPDDPNANQDTSSDKDKSKASGSTSPTVSNPAATPVSKIASPQTTYSVVNGKTLTIPVVAYTTDGSKAKLKYESSDKKIATINSKGKITAKKTGTVKITISAANGKKTTVTVKVVKKAVAVKKVSVSKAPKSLKNGKTKFLKVKLSPAKPTGVIVKFKSSAPKVLSVDKAGKITAKKTGKATITVTAGNKSKKIKIQVK